MAATSGDREALGALLDRHWTLLQSMCRRMLRDEEATAEACQEAAVRAIVGLSLLRNPASFGPWLVGIGLNQSRAILRQNAARRREVSWSQQVIRSPQQPDPADVVADEDLAVRVRAAIDNLPVGQREAVRIYYLEGLNHREVASALEIPPGSAKTRLHKARTKLRQELGAVFPQEVQVMNRSAQWLPVEVADVLTSDAMTIAVLKERGGQRRRVAIGMSFEAGTALSAALSRTGLPRPTGHDLTAEIVRRSTVSFEEVRVNRVKDRVFYAEVRLAGDPNPIDSRPSDALNLALRLAVPIRISAAILESDGLAEDATDADLVKGAGGKSGSHSDPENLDFEQRSANEDWTLPGWFRCGGPGKYDITLDELLHHSGTASARVTFTGNSFTGGFGGIGQECTTERFGNHRVCLAGMVRTHGISEGWAGLWLRIDTAAGSIAIDNMGQSSGRGITGTTDWTRYEVVMDVPEEAIRLAYGYILSGNGVAWADDLELEVVGALGEGPPTTI